MIRGLESLMLFSEDAAKLAKFYKDKVGLKTTGEFEMGDKGQKVYVFEFSKTSDLYIVDEPKVKGKNKTPQRFTLNLEVGDIKKEVKRLKGKKVKLYMDTYHIQGYGWAASFADVDGNCFQLVQVKAN